MAKALLTALFILIYGSACTKTKATTPRVPPPIETLELDDPAEVAIGERLFHEVRFSQFFFANFEGQWNRVLAAGDPALDQLETLEGLKDHPYKGSAMSCAACHFVDQAAEQAGVNLYNDFAIRTPIPTRREDILSRTTRHTMSLVGTSLEIGTPLHWDGEFFSAQDLTRASLVGRNMGWQLSEVTQARHHLAEVIRRDNGSFPSDTKIPGSYRQLFAADSSLPEALRLPEEFRLDVARASDSEIITAVSRLIAVYIQSLDYQRDAQGLHSGSAYDQFLKLNALPQKPAESESAAEYATRLAQAIEEPRSWKWIQEKAKLKYHDQVPEFGDMELRGMRLFFGRAACAQCHIPPNFSDGGFHNTGISQFEYEKFHGLDTFKNLAVPSLEERRLHPELYLVATEASPQDLGIYRQSPSAQDSKAADFGVWNIFAHPHMPGVQSQLRERVRQSLQLSTFLSDAELLPLTQGLFKTPGLRDLGQSAPYFHDGSARDPEAVLISYMRAALLQKQGRLVNGDTRLAKMEVFAEDLEPLLAFMRALNEDYD